MENNTLLKDFVQGIRETVNIEKGDDGKAHGLDIYLPELLEPFIKEVLMSLQHPEIRVNCFLLFDRIQIRLRWYCKKQPIGDWEK